MLNDMYSNNIRINLKAELIGGDLMLKICVRNEHAESSRFILATEACMPQVLYYWINQAIHEVAVYCSKEGYDD